MTKKTYFSQFFPIFLSMVTCLFLVGLLFILIQLLNLFPLQQKITPLLRITDVLVGLTIYIKTSVDFAIFIGNLMKKYLGITNRIAIEIGTAFGNGIGTMLVLIIWTFFKQIPLLMAAMILLASLVLFRLAEESLCDFLQETSVFMQNEIRIIYFLLKKINKIFIPITHIIIPQTTKKTSAIFSFSKLLLFSFSIPFILGLDDFAGYIPLFSIINVFGFATGVFLGHMLLNIALFASPEHTIKIVRLPIILVSGGLVFIAIAFFGFYDVYRLLSAIFL